MHFVYRLTLMALVGTYSYDLAFFRMKFHLPSTFTVRGHLGFVRVDLHPRCSQYDASEKNIKQNNIYLIFFPSVIGWQCSLES